MIAFNCASQGSLLPGTDTRYTRSCLPRDLACAMKHAKLYSRITAVSVLRASLACCITPASNRLRGSFVFHHASRLRQDLGCAILAYLCTPSSTAGLHSLLVLHASPASCITPPVSIVPTLTWLVFRQNNKQYPTGDITSLPLEPSI